MLEWPSMSWTTFNSTPAASASVAAPWRRSCSPDRRQPVLGDQLTQQPRQPVRGQRVTVWHSEDVAAVAAARPGLHAFLSLPVLVFTQGRHGGVVQGDDAGAGGGLGRARRQHAVML